MSTTTENINKNLINLKSQEKATNKAYNWLNDEIGQDKKDTIKKKQLFINEIKNGLGEEILSSDQNPRVIEKPKESLVKKFLNLFR